MRSETEIRRALWCLQETYKECLEDDDIDGGTSLNMNMGLLHWVLGDVTGLSTGFADYLKVCEEDEAQKQADEGQGETSTIQ